MKNYHDKDDKELLEYFYADHDNEWLGILLERYTLLLYGVCMKYLKDQEEAKDGVQQIFLKVINELQKYKVEYFKSWLYMVAKNHCLMKLRDRSKHTIEINDNVMAAAAELTDKQDLTEKEKSLDQMTTALGQLNKEQHECIKLFYLEKKSYQQISSITGYNLMQIKSHIQNGKRNLKIYMERSAK